ncbi:lasso RiPP family leader peptide-containing protein [Streptomyces sp. UNOC14_S4]|nr:lasso RiPP family leader peptide-containing protein [Streptomyces sp. UNOC14_S4]MCC3768554.1 lasso RiPP family leader peptide-containing protein [Streptomyces sp. UNOC14_S4]
MEKIEYQVPALVEIGNFGKLTGDLGIGTASDGLFPTYIRPGLAR